MSNADLVVLLVDDDVNILHGYSRRFREYDFSLYTARSAEEAIEVMKRNKIDVVVSDECMKGIRGTELLAWVAEHFPHTSRIILTGQPSVPSMEAAINQSGVFRYLMKPVDAPVLAETIIASATESTNPTPQSIANQ